MDWDALSKGLPVSFGKQVIKKQSKSTEQIESTKRVGLEPQFDGPVIDLRSIASTSTLTDEVSSSHPGQPLVIEDGEEEEEDEGEEADWVETREGFDLPVSHEVIMKDHSKVS